MTLAEQARALAAELEQSNPALYRGNEGRLVTEIANQLDMHPYEVKRALQRGKRTGGKPKPVCPTCGQTIRKKPPVKKRGTK